MKLEVLELVRGQEVSVERKAGVDAFNNALGESTLRTTNRRRTVLSADNELGHKGIIIGLDHGLFMNRGINPNPRSAWKVKTGDPAR
jgi:hypothetical protein